MTHALVIDTVVFDTPTRVNGENLKMAANRYTINQTSQSGVTLLAIHAGGTHKEYWEPILETLLPRVYKSSTCIREVWALDWQSHGDSAVLNAGIFARCNYIPTVADWGEAIAAFVQTFLVNHRIICIGHSVGTHAIMYSTTRFDKPSIPYQCIILIEPGMIDKQLWLTDIRERTRAQGVVMKFFARAPSEWESRIVASQFLKKQRPWSGWDERTRTIYVNQGLHQSTTDGRSLRVVPKARREHEVALYLEPETNFIAIEQITKLCHRIPFHVVFGDKMDFWPQYCQDSVVDTSKGRNITSITYVPGGGHMVVQQRPDGVADAIYRILTSGQTSSRATSNL